MLCSVKQVGVRVKIEAKTPKQYMDQLPNSRKQAMAKLRETIPINIPSGFEETISCGIIGSIFPHSIYKAIFIKY